MRTALLVTAALLVAPIVQAQAEPAGKRVTTNGCVSTGVEFGCLIIRDRKTNEPYSIGSASPRPDPARGLMVHLTGIVSAGLGICMEGPRLEKIKWNYTKTKCPK
jgi:hypothetical protein